MCFLSSLSMAWGLSIQVDTSLGGGVAKLRTLASPGWHAVNSPASS